ncbi:MAG: Gfo/Idh/MocA family oxidoreductase [Lachnospiraceae bacterium]|nr:Gfo/Idh/MocA family oxidoreductase [Lachnospiraceae bacterium]
MAKLKVGIIGIGEIGTTKHLRQLTAHLDEVEITALCDLQVERCEKANSDFGINAAVYTDYKEMLEKEQLDVVHVCTPNPLHAEMAIAAFGKGAHVYCEKPIACNYEDAKKILAARDAAGKQLASGTQWRYNTAPMEMKRMFDNGEFGDVYYIRSTQLRPRRLPAYGVYTNKELNGGGVLMDGGPHSIDLPMWMTNNYDVATVRGVTFDKMKNFPEGNDLGPWDPENFDVEDSAYAMITMKNGAMFYVETAWCSNMLQEAPGIVCSVAGTLAGADMVGPGFENFVRVTKMVDGKLTTTTTEPEAKYDMWAYDMDKWVLAVTTGSEPAVTGEQAAVVTRVIEAIYRSAETGETIVFD